MTFEQLFVDPRGRTSRAAFLPALLVIIAVVLFYALLARGRTGQFCLLVLVYPAAVLHARRLHDLGRSSWLLAPPVTLLLLSFGIWLKYLDLGEPLNNALPVVSLSLCGALALWCALARGQSSDQQHNDTLR